MIRLNSISLPFDHSEKDLKNAILKHLRIPEEDIISFRIIKRSLDARKKRPMSRVYSLQVEVKNQAALSGVILKSDRISLYRDKDYELPVLLNENEDQRPLIVGTGPAGIFAGLILAEVGLSPVLFERGKEVQERTRDVNGFWRNRLFDPDSNVQFGEGGAGTFSDGKLRTRVKDKSQRTRKILQEMVAAGAPEEILFDNKPHVGTSNLVKVVKNLRGRIERLGGEYRFGAKVVDLIIEGDQILGVTLSDGEEILSRIVILAIGHSARDTFLMLHDLGIELAPKPFSVGFRIEHPQEMINRNQYGKFAGHPGLGSADYQLAFRTSPGRSVYSFCMCPGGTVIGSSSEAESVVTNGMSQFARAETNANSAIVAEVFPEDYGNEALDGFLFQRKWEKNAYALGGEDYNAPVQLVGDFLSDKASVGLGEVIPTYLPGYKIGDLSKALPFPIISSIKEALPEFEKRIPGFVMLDAVLTGVETRTSSPLRILRDSDLQSVSIKGLYPVGEGSGYAGGIMSSSIDGIKAAEIVIRKINESAT